MVPVAIETLVVGIPPSPSVIVLRPDDNSVAAKRVLPIWIGPTEAASIGIALEGQTHVRPMTHDFLVSIIHALDSKVDRVVVDRAEGSTFYATVYLERDGRTINVDARPSDSIALAVRLRVPLFVDEDVMNSSSYPFELVSENNKDATIDQFRDFLDSITPEDFSRVE
jgi:bifunctional DNase/RNase